MKKFFLIFCICILTSGYSVYAFDMLESPKDSDKNILILELSPFNEVKGCEVFINNGNPYIYNQQKIECQYYKLPDDSIKIEVNMPFDSKYKSKTYFFKEAKKNLINITLSKKLSETSQKIAKMTTETINAILRYSETKDIQEFRKASSTFGSAYYLSDFIDEINTLDEEAINEFILVIKQNLFFPNVNHETIANKVIDNTFRIKELIKEVAAYKDKNKNMSEKQKKELLEKMTSKLNEIIWDTYDVVKTVMDR